MPATSPSPARITAALTAAQQSGLPVREVRVEPDGTLRILVGAPEPGIGSSGEGNSCDAVFFGTGPA